MADNEVTITGLAEVQQLLDNSAALIVAKGFHRGLTAGGGVLAGELVVRTPRRVDASLRDQDQIPLAESTVVAVTLDSRLRGGTVEVGFGAQGHVANFIEYGHRIVGHRPKKKDTGKSVPANPFMRATVAAAGDRAIEAFQEALTEALREDFGG